MMVSATPIFPLEPITGPGLLDGTLADNLPCSASEFSGQDTGPSQTGADAGSRSTVSWTTRHRVELIRRLETLQRTRFISGHSSESPVGRSRLDVRDGGGSERVIRELEVDIAALRDGLAALRTQLADEPLPAYAE